ncbi:hypothetical protein NM208_g7430 [Fusarium decemcellulare]|uniref:Uncharacterized protein n=1 Tax=Fusarium decemcellulare TaxID=57161 RepID=A0ACC1S970_9HYPO|nr:hypothetical protein NM208_g7430 [Fusarium decemcellulare]
MLASRHRRPGILPNTRWRRRSRVSVLQHQQQAEHGAPPKDAPMLYAVPDKHCTEIASEAHPLALFRPGAAACDAGNAQRRGLSHPPCNNNKTEKDILVFRTDTAFEWGQVAGKGGQRWPLCGVEPLALVLLVKLG